MDPNSYYFAVLLDERVEYCKGVDHLCDFMAEGYLPIVFANSMKKIFDLMADFY